MIVDTWPSDFEKRKTETKKGIKQTTTKRMWKEPTYDSVCEIIGVTNLSQDIGITLRESVKFFEKFRLGLDVVNVWGEMLFNFRPVNGLHTAHSPQVLRILVHNNHPYKLDQSAKNKLDNLRSKKNDIELTGLSKLRVSPYYSLRKPVLDEEYEIHFIENLDDCRKIMIETKSKKVRLITNTNLTDLLFDMRKEKYTPAISYGGNRILSLVFKVGTIKGIIENADTTSPDDSLIDLENKEIYEEFHKVDDEFYAKILKQSVMSDYPPSVLELEKMYPMGPCSGYFDTYEEHRTYNAIDTPKAYPSCLEEMNIVPVFGYFDLYQQYDNHEIEDYTMYCVETHAKVKEESIMFPAVYYRSFGFKLKAAYAKGIGFVIHQFRRPSQLEHVNYKGDVETVFNHEKLPMEHRKYIN